MSEESGLLGVQQSVAGTILGPAGQLHDTLKSWLLCVCVCVCVCVFLLSLSHSFILNIYRNLDSIHSRWESSIINPAKV